MRKPSTKPTDANELESYRTVAGFEVALLKGKDAELGTLFRIVLRSRDNPNLRETLYLTDKKRDATQRLMAFHAGACAMQRALGIKLDRAA